MDPIVACARDNALPAWHANNQLRRLSQAVETGSENRTFNRSKMQTGKDTAK